MERLVTKRPGTCCITVGNTEVWFCRVSVSRPMTVTVIGRWRTSVALRVPVTTTSCSDKESLTVSADTLAGSKSVPTAEAMNTESNLFIICQY